MRELDGSTKTLLTTNTALVAHGEQGGGGRRSQGQTAARTDVNKAAFSASTRPSSPSSHQWVPLRHFLYLIQLGCGRRIIKT